jgi:hypothetical protein
MAFDIRGREHQPRTLYLCLLQFGEDVGKIVSSAAKELVIETELKKLADLWRDQRFILHKYKSVSLPGLYTLQGCPAGSLFPGLARLFGS